MFKTNNIDILHFPMCCMQNQCLFFVKNNVTLLHCTFYKTDQFDITDFTPTEL